MLGKRIALYAMGPVGVAALGFIILPLLTWVATPQTVAIYSLFTVVLNLTVMASTFGLDQALVRFYHATTDKVTLLAKTLFPGLILVLVASAIVLSLNVELSGNTIGLVGANNPLILAIILAYSSRYLSLVLRMEDRAFQYSFSQLLPKIWLLSALLYCFLLEQIVSKEVIVYLLLAGWFLTVIYQGVYAKLSIGSTTKVCAEQATAKALWSYGLPLLISACSYYLLMASDKFFIKQMIDLEAVAQYSTSAHFANVIIIIQSVFVAIWPPFIYKLFDSKSNHDKVESIVLATGAVMTFVVALLWSLTGLASNFIEFILPEHYSAIRQLMPTLVAVPLLCLFAEVTGIGINLRKKTIFHSIATLTALLVNLILNYLLIPVYGIGGAAIATVLSFFLYFVIKTESAAHLGFPVKRSVLYSLLIVFLVISIYFVLFNVERLISIAVWMGLLILTSTFIFLKRDRLKQHILSLKKDVSDV